MEHGGEVEINRDDSSSNSSFVNFREFINVDLGFEDLITGYLYCHPVRSVEGVIKLPLKMKSKYVHTN